MGRSGGCDFSELTAFQERMERLANDMGIDIEYLAKQTAAMLLKRVTELTPVGRYDGAAYVCESKLHHKGMRKKNGNNGSTLRKSWTSRVYRSGNLVTIEIKNPVKYASYVENGHRIRKKVGTPENENVTYGWAMGHFMMTLSVYEVQRDAPGILEKKIKKEMEAALR